MNSLHAFVDLVGQNLTEFKLDIGNTRQEIEEIFLDKEIFQKINCELQVLHIQFPSNHPIAVPEMKFPRLKELKLRNCILIHQLDPETKLSLESLQISHCRIRQDFLIDYLSGCANLEKLGDTDFLPPTRRVLLPKLKQFSVEVKDFSVADGC